MKHWVSYDPPTGQITGWGYCQDSDFALQQTKAPTVEGIGTPSTHWVNDDQLVMYTPEQLALKANRPEFALSWSNSTMSWEMLPSSEILDTLRYKKWEAVKANRSAAIEADMQTPFGVFQCRQEDRQNISDAVLLAQTMESLGQPVSIVWTLADNTSVQLDASAVQTVGLMLGAKVQQAHAQSRALRQQIDAAQTVEALNEISWSM